MKYVLATHLAAELYTADQEVLTSEIEAWYFPSTYKNNFQIFRWIACMSELASTRSFSWGPFAVIS